jgi:hypothetical protein
MLLPNFERAIIDLGKLAGYALNPGHPEGRHKARVFLSALGVAAADAAWLADAILARLGQSEAILQSTTRWGDLYRVDMEIVRGHRCAKVRTARLSMKEEARLVTCFVIGECYETA